MSYKDDLWVKILHEVSKKLPKLTEAEAKAILHGERKIVLLDFQEPDKIKPTTKQKASETKDLEGVAKQLKTSSTEAEAMELLLPEKRYTKDQLATIGAYLGVKWSNKNKKSEIIKLLVEETVGFKVRAAVIHTLGK